jgi:dihydroxy-acid dehydratase
MSTAARSCRAAAKRQDLNIVSVFEAVGENAAGRMSEDLLRLSAARAIPSTSSCGGMYTAQRCPAFEGFGHFAATQRTIASPRRDELGSRASAQTVEAVKKDINRATS